MSDEDDNIERGDLIDPRTGFISKTQRMEMEMKEKLGVKKHPEEPRKDFLKRVMIAISKISDEEWRNLSKETKQWYNRSAEFVEKGFDPCDLPRKMWTHPVGHPSAVHRLTTLIMENPHVSRRQYYAQMKEEGYIWTKNSFRQYYYMIRSILESIQSIKENRMKTGHTD